MKKIYLIFLLGLVYGTQSQAVLFAPTTIFGSTNFTRFSNAPVTSGSQIYTPWEQASFTQLIYSDITVVR